MTTPSQRKANAIYKKKTYKRVPLNIRFNDYENLKNSAEKASQPVNTYIKQAIQERMERENKLSK